MLSLSWPSRRAIDSHGFRSLFFISCSVEDGTGDCPLRVHTCGPFSDRIIVSCEFLDTRGDLGRVVGGETHQKLELIQISAGFFPATRPDRGWRHVRNTSERRRIGERGGGIPVQPRRSFLPICGRGWLWHRRTVYSFFDMYSFLTATTNTAHDTPISLTVCPFSSVTVCLKLHRSPWGHAPCRWRSTNTESLATSCPSHDVVWQLWRQESTLSSTVQTAAAARLSPD